MYLRSNWSAKFNDYRALFRKQNAQLIHRVCIVPVLGGVFYRVGLLRQYGRT